MMRIVTIATALLLAGCASHGPVDTDLLAGPAFLDVDGLDVEGVIVPADRIDDTFVAPRFDDVWTPSAQDVLRLERGLRQGLIDANARPEIHEHLAQYRRQYLGVIVDGRRRVFVNAFWGIGPDGDDRHSYWKHRAVFVFDGGHFYWRIQFDVESGEYVDFEQNGYA